MGAVGGKVSEARVEQALSRFNNCVEDALLVLLEEELDGTGKDPGVESTSVPKPFGAGDKISVLQDFMSNNKTPVQLSQGQAGNVIKIDGAGDAYIDFGGSIGKQWVKGKSFHLMTQTEAAADTAAAKFAPPPRDTPAPASAPPKAAAKPAAKPARKASAKAAKSKRPALQRDDYDDYY